MNASEHARFWAKVDTSGGADACWPWTAWTCRGYGRFALNSGQKIRAHRTVYEQLVGPIPDGLVIDHLCRNRGCCNPAHMEPVTPRENTLRGEGIQAANARKTHCVNGHEFTPENTMHDAARPKRRCRQCDRLRSARYYREKAAA